MVVEAFAEHPSDTIDNVQWDSQYREHIQSGDPAQINQVRLTCGDRLISTAFYEVRLFAVLHVSSQIQTRLLQFRGHASGNLNLDVVSASAALGGDATISEANRQGAIYIEIFSEGFGGVTPTTQMIGVTTADGLGTIAEKLRSALGGMTEVGQPVKYKLVPLPGIPSGELNDDRIFDKLSGLKQAYEQNRPRAKNVEMLLSSGDPRRAILRQPVADTQLTVLSLLLSQYLDSVATSHGTCKKANSLTVCNSALGAVPAVPPSRPVELLPFLPPSLGPFFFAIDGIPVLPGTKSPSPFTSRHDIVRGSKGTKARRRLCRSSRVQPLGLHDAC
jgi:hypothetical protein